MSDVSTLNTYRDAAAAALASGDFATALSNARAALAMLSAMPDTRDAAGHSLAWDREAIVECINQCTRAQSVAAGIQRTNITRARPTTS